MNTFVNSGGVYYEVITRGNGLSIINQVDTYISNNQSISFSADWILVAKWINICNSNFLVPCSSNQVKYYVFKFLLCLLRQTRFKQ